MQSCADSGLRLAARHLSYITNASNFETEVLQSQQAICLVYHIPNSNCAAYLAAAEKLVDAINAETTGLDTPASEAGGSGAVGQPVDQTLIIDAAGAPSPGVAVGVAGSPTAAPATMEWLKLCTVNADENRNLASAFSVERAKLPITYFVMQGTIVDKVMGHISDARLHGILVNFLEHYQKELNVDLLARHSKAGVAPGGAGGSTASPLPSAATADLLSGTSTTFLQDKIMNALVGADMIQLPEEAEKLDGLRRTLQGAKKKAHAELQELHKQLGMDVRRLTEAEMQAHYFNATQFRALGVLCALEALYLARSHATLGDVARANVDWARRAVVTDFAAIQGDPTLRRVLALVDTNLIRGELRTAAMLAAQDANRLSSTLAAMDAADPRSAQHRHALTDMQVFVAGQSQYCLDMLRIIDAHVDSRTLDGSTFPSAVVDQLFDQLRSNLKLSRTRVAQTTASQQQQQQQREQRTAGPDAHDANTSMQGLVDGTALDTTAKRVLTAQARVAQLRTVITSLLQLYPMDSRSHDARSRLASLVL
ncbi:hypothetical protein NESM_000356400 [Novymonas esmeraldas]|uniref:Uncharacterized protein n=1 Tax=Novymonas esmeraldas TaxID=1808958 RepID=A0AAW0EK07_9TRYP